MALTERTEEDKIEIIGALKNVQVRTATVIEKDGIEISRTFHRHVVHPGDDVTGECAELQSVAGALWTADVIAAYEASVGAASTAE